MKKRLLSLLLALALLCAALPVLAEDAAPSAAGVWKMTRLTVGSRVVEDPAAVGSKKVLQLNEDGTAQVTINDSVYNATWTETENAVHLVYEDGDLADFTLEGEQLVYAVGDQVQYFTRRITAQADALVGCWENFAVRFLEDNALYTIDDLAPYFGEMIILYEDGTGDEAMVGNGNTYYDSFTWTANENGVDLLYEGASSPISYQLIDDQLVFTADAHILYFRKVFWPEDFPKTVEASDMADYLGNWELYAMDGRGVDLPRLIPGILFPYHHILSIWEDSVAMVVVDREGGEPSNIMWLPKIVDGALQISVLAGANDEQLTASLTECGWLALPIKTASSDITLYFTKIPDETPALPEPVALPQD